MKTLFTLIVIFSFEVINSQDFGDLKKIKKEKLVNDLNILHQALDKFHSGMYWYTSKDSIDKAFLKVNKTIRSDMNVLEFHKKIAPLVALSREDHTDIKLPKTIIKELNKNAKYLPFTFVFLGEKLFCVKNGSEFSQYKLEGKEIELINNESPKDIVKNLGKLFASDGFIKITKYHDLRGFNFSKYYFYYYGFINKFKIKFKNIDSQITVNAKTKTEITNQFRKRYKKHTSSKQDLLEFRVLKDSIAYLGVHSFSNSDIKENMKVISLESFLEKSFASIHKKNIKIIIVDVSKNSGGSEGNEGLLYSYFGENYRKYKKVRVKTQKAILDNGVDKPIVLKAFGFLEKTFLNKKQEDGSFVRRENIGKGLMAFKKSPKYKFYGKTYILIGPETYSGGSEFSNMMYSQQIGTFVGQETGGGYYGNTSGYSKKLILPNSKIEIYIPALQFIMNVKPILPFGSGVKPHYKVVPSFSQYINKENASLSFILNHLEKESF